MDGVSPRRRMSWLNDARCSRLSSRGRETKVPLPWIRCSSPSAIRLSIALRTVARDTSYVVISSRSEGIAASGPSSVRREVGQHVGELRVLRTGAVRDHAVLARSAR